MAIQSGYSSPYSRMKFLATEVCGKQLRKSKLENTLKELYPDGNVPEYSILFNTLICRLKKEVYQAFSQDECLLKLLPKMKGDTIDQYAEFYGGSIESMKRIERTLSELNYQRPPRSLAQNDWCVIC